MRLIIRYILVVTLVLAAQLSGNAQPCGAPPLPPCDPGDPVPITGIELLIGAGALLGAKKIRDAKRKR